MTLTTRRALPGCLVFLGLFVGSRAAFLPASSHASFPGPFGSWIAMDGPYDEHLVRDVGTLNLGLAAPLVLTRTPHPVTTQEVTP